MSIFPQVLDPVFAQERDIPFLDGVSLRARGTRICGRIGVSRCTPSLVSHLGSPSPRTPYAAS